MEIQQLRYVAAVMRAGNFSRAAEQCHVSQPSLSQQIQKLEGELGERLFERRGRQTRPTPAGEQFIPRALRILEELSEAQREAKEAHQLARGELIIGVLPTIAPYLMPPVISRFTRKFPGVSIVIQEEMTAGLMRLTDGHEVDLAVASLPIRDRNIEIKELFTEELLLALPSGHPLSRRRAISTADLESVSFIFMKEGHCLGEQALRFCSGRNFHPRISSRSAQLETVQSLVQAGLGVSLIPAMAKKSGTERLPVYRSLQNPAPRRTIAAFWSSRRPLSRAGSEFLKELKRAGRKKLAG